MKTKCPVVGVDVYREKREREKIRDRLFIRFVGKARHAKRKDFISLYFGHGKSAVYAIRQNERTRRRAEREAVDSLSEKEATEKIPVNAGKTLISADAWKVARLRNFKG